MKEFNMPKLRTKEELELLFKKSREENLKKKELQKKKYQQAAEEVKRELDKKFKRLKKAAKKEQKRIIPVQPIYHSNLVEREPDENELYMTREELKQAEKRGEGCINWCVWERLIMRGRRTLGGRR